VNVLAVTKLATPAIDWLAIAPVISLAVAAIAIVLLRALVRRANWVYDASLLIAFIGVAVAAVFLAEQWSKIRDVGNYQAIAGMVAVDGFAVFLGVVVLIATALVLLLSSEYLPRHGFESKP
jgi:NADH:ubiquinone oxidoreductase subunit 2 (subunit N)